MTDYIKREPLLAWLSNMAVSENIIEAISNKERFPSADVVEVKHSKWIGFPNNGVWDLKCDNCHRIIPFGQTPDTMHYCPQCGYKMDLE